MTSETISHRKKGGDGNQGVLGKRGNTLDEPKKKTNTSVLSTPDGGQRRQGA